MKRQEVNKVLQSIELIPDESVKDEISNIIMGWSLENAKKEKVKTSSSLQEGVLEDKTGAYLKFSKKEIEKMSDNYCNHKKAECTLGTQCFTCPFQTTPKDSQTLKNGYKECWKEKAKFTDEDFEKHVKNMYLDVAKEIGDDPVEVANDGDVTALAGSMSLKSGQVLGIAMGTSEAAGYVNKDGNLNGWLSELAFVPVDYNKGAMVDEWSGDYGCGVKYFSQDGVIKLAENAGFKFEENTSPAEKLKVIQKLMAENDQMAKNIYHDIGTYLGYAIPYYAEFYQIKHLLILINLMKY